MKNPFRKAAAVFVLAAACAALPGCTAQAATVQVGDKAELMSALRRSERGSHIVLTKDIYAGFWTPVDNFHGTIDGRGHVIKALKINSDSPYAGLLGYTNSAVTIKNLGVEIETAASVRGERVGAVGGFFTDLFQSESSDYSYAGGLIGLADKGSTVTIENCFVSGSVTADIHYEVLSRGNAYAYAGGLVGRSMGRVAISGCYTTGNIYAYASGMRHMLAGSPKSQSFAGGLVGHGAASVVNSYSTCAVAAEGQNPSAGGLVGGGTASVTGSYYFDRITNKKNNQGNAILYKDITNEKSFPASSGWNFGAEWKYTEGMNDGCPDLAVFPRERTVYVGTEEELRLIGGPGSAGVTYVLRNDIELPNWTPVNDFRGTLDGQGHTISNLNVALKGNGSIAGLFGYIRTGDVTIKNLNVTAGRVTVDCATGEGTALAYGGGLIGLCTGGRVRLENCTFNGGVSVEARANVNGAAIIDAAMVLVPTLPMSLSETGREAAAFVTGLAHDAMTPDQTTACAGGLIGAVGPFALVKIDGCSASGTVDAWASEVGWFTDDSASYSGGLIGAVKSIEENGGRNIVFIGDNVSRSSVTADGASMNPFNEKQYVGQVSGNDERTGSAAEFDSMFGSPKPLLKIQYSAHMRDVGDVPFVSAGNAAGMVGMSVFVLEELTLKTEFGTIRAQAHVQDKGDMPAKEGSQVSVGTRGQKLRMESVCLELKGAPGHALRYRVLQEQSGWSAWASQGEWCGVKGRSLGILAVQIELQSQPARGPEALAEEFLSDYLSLFIETSKEFDDPDPYMPLFEFYDPDTWEVADEILPYLRKQTWFDANGQKHEIKESASRYQLYDWEGNGVPMIQIDFGNNFTFNLHRTELFFLIDGTWKNVYSSDRLAPEFYRDKNGRVVMCFYYDDSPDVESLHYATVSDGALKLDTILDSTDGIFYEYTEDGKLLSIPGRPDEPLELMERMILLERRITDSITQKLKARNKNYKVWTE